MKIAENKVLFRYLFIIIALAITIGSLVVSRSLTKDLQQEEHYKIKIWAEAMKELVSNSENMSTTLILQIMESNTTIPLVLYDKNEGIYTSNNIVLPKNNEQDFLRKKVLAFSRNHSPIIIESEGVEQYLYYDNSYTLKRLQIYPYVQLGALTLFVIISLLALLSTKRMEQDRLWVGLSKETAHQLGTPLSSLLAWLEHLKTKNIETSIVSDMEKDVSRLQMVADRFSKIGSKAVLEEKDIRNVLEQIISYMENRMSKKVSFHHHFPQYPIQVHLNEPLFGWVIENLTKNAVDAMDGIGSIVYTLVEDAEFVYLDVSDTGKGIPKSKFKTIFNPGYSTKARGWGLGLSLAKRIVESYHKGKIFVKESEVNAGSTFRIELRKII